MATYPSNIYLYIQRLFLILFIGLHSTMVLLGGGIHQDSSVFNVANLDSKPAFLYQNLKVYKTVDFESAIDSGSLEHFDFLINNTKVNYESNSSYYAKLEIYNSSSDTVNTVLNFSPNNWNQSWDKIRATVYRDNRLISDTNTGNALSSEDKPVPSAMNLMRIKVNPHDQLTIYVYLQGSTIATTNTPNHIDFVLLKEDQTPGLIKGYPFEGAFINRKSLSPFLANHLINHEIYQDENKSKTIKEIVNNWETLETNDIFNTTPEVDAVYWLKSEFIGTPQLNGVQIFQVGNSPYWSNGIYNPAVEIFSFNNIDGYYEDSKGLYNHQRAGDHVKIRERPLRFWANFLTVNIPVGDTIEYFVRLEGGDKRFSMLSIVMYHIAPGSIFPSQVNQGWRHGLYYGALGIYLLFFLLLFIVERETLYLYFSIGILGLLMMNIFPEDIFSRFVVFPTWRDFHVPLYFLGTFALPFGFLKFTEKYLLIEKSSIVSRFVIPGFLTMFGMAALYCSLQFEYIPGIGNPIMEPYMLFLIFLQIISITLPLVIAMIAKPKKGVSKFSYFISFTPLIVAGIFHFGNILFPNLFNIGGFYSNEELDQSYNFIQIGVAAMLTLFAMNVGFRSNRLKAHKKQAIALAEKNAIIEAKSQQNETLLKEIHHRVKNNLQTISSLLYLQSYGEKDQQTKQNIAVTQQRVESMALIHKNLYQRDNLAAIEMKAYIKTLCENLISSYQSKGTPVVLKLEMPVFELDIDRAIPMGLIINEIVTNALKYAFTTGREGVITISLLQREDGRTSLAIADNGIGMSADATPSFGTQLIKLLSKQINADVQSGNDRGYWIIINWIDEEEMK